MDYTANRLAVELADEVEEVFSLASSSLVLDAVEEEEVVEIVAAVVAAVVAGRRRELAEREFPSVERESGNSNLQDKTKCNQSRVNVKVIS